MMNLKDSFSHIFGNFIIFKCSLDFITDEFEYEAWSPLFDEIAEGIAAPSYALIIKHDFDGDTGDELLSLSSVIREKVT